MSTAIEKQTQAPEKTLVVPIDKTPEVLQVLGVLLKTRGSIGLTEEDIPKRSGLERDDALRSIAHLEREGFVTSFLCQEGTAGPYARRYRLSDHVTVDVVIKRKEAS